MSVYFVKSKGWRYDFTIEGERYTGAWFETKRAALQAEGQRKEDISEGLNNPETQTDMSFLELVNQRLDYVKTYDSKKHYDDYRYRARRWIRLWGNMNCSEISHETLEPFIFERSRISAQTANMEIRSLRATFNFAKRRDWIADNPTKDVGFLPVEKRVRYLPSQRDIDTVIAAADKETQDYLWAIRDTMARVSEINRLCWDDVNLQDRYVVLYTRKKKGGHLTPRKVPMTERLFEIISGRFERRGPERPWVFWHRYWSRTAGKWREGPFMDRKKFMKTLCEKAGVRYFRFHALRHAGASVMDNNNVPIGAIQRILGHENRETTEIYLHSIGRAEREAITVFEQARAKSHMKAHTAGGNGNSQ
jgi:integrase